MVYADDVNILVESVLTVKKNTAALIVTNKETRHEVNTDNSKYMIMSRDQNAGRSHITKIDNNSFKREENFKYLGKTLMNRNSIQEEIMRKLNPRNTCYHLVQNLLSFSLL